MKNVLRWTQGWEGVWSGQGERAGGEPVLLRSEFSSTLEGYATSLQFEMFEPGSGALIYGVRTILARDLDGGIRSISYSTRFGVMSLVQTPDDEGVLALSGVTDDGVQVNVAFIQEDRDTLQLNVIWRPAGELLATGNKPSIHGVLKRAAAFKPGPP